MTSLVSIAHDITDIDKSYNDDTFSDRLSHRYTTTMLIVFAVAVSMKQFVGEQINCWEPVHFTDNHVEYTNNFCWVRNTYYLPYGDEVPKEGEEWKQNTIVYYQWVPLILVGQAFLFYLPCLIWRGLASKSGLNTNSVTQWARNMAMFLPEDSDIRTKCFQQMANQIHRYLSNCKLEANTSFTISLKHIFSKTCCRLCGHKRGNYLLFLFLFTKLLYLLNAIGQLFILNLMLDSGYRVYGIQALKALTEGQDWAITGLFPRVTMCDLKVRRLGSIHRYTVQCVLPVNLFNEKIYLFLWFWLVFVIAATFISLLKWSLRAIVKVDRHRYVKRHLKLAGITPNSENAKREMIAFVENYLHPDGVFLLQLVDQSTNSLIALELTRSLWDYRNSKKRIEEIEEER